MLAAGTPQTTTIPTAPYTGWGWALGVIAGLVVLALLALAWFYWEIQKSDFIERLLGVAAPEGDGKAAHALGDRAPSAFRFAEEFLAKRTEFWLLYAQFIISAVFVGTVSALILVGAISLEAGLPALSGVVGIVLGKTLLSSRGTPQTMQEQTVSRGPVNISPPNLKPGGTASVNTALRADPGEWSGQPPIAYTYSWNRRGASGDLTISGAQQETYTTTSDDADSRISVVVTASNPFGTATATSNGVLIAALETLTATTAPTISGDAIVGTQLTADPGQWADSNLQTVISWERDADDQTWTAIENATGNSYTPTAADEGHRLRVTVKATATDDRTGTASSDPTATVVAGQNG